MVLKAMAPGEPPVIRGKVEEALVYLWEDGIQIEAVRMHDELVPYQTNNLTAWYRAAIKTLGDKVLRMRGYDLEGPNIEVLVNDGLGPKKGKGSHENEFRFGLVTDGIETMTIVIKVLTVSHQKAWAQRKQSGEVGGRKSWDGTTYWDLGLNKIFQWKDNLKTHVAWTPDEYFKVYPQHEGRVPVKQLGRAATTRGGGAIDG